MPTPEIFDFDTESLADYNPNRIELVLLDHPGVYVSHLFIANHLEGWASRLLEGALERDSDFNRGYGKALREVAAHLRQGDYVPSGAFMDDLRREIEDRERIRH